jgi:hypothetical protein
VLVSFIAANHELVLSFTRGRFNGTRPNPVRAFFKHPHSVQKLGAKQDANLPFRRLLRLGEYWRMLRRHVERYVNRT